MKYQHIFGPVLSRRLGISLGVDLVYHKVCDLDCVYCECGKTTEKVMERKEYVRLDTIKKELAHYFTHFPDPDAVTFSGSGEPTLHSGIGQVIEFIKREKPKAKVVVLTNSTLLQDPEVRRELLAADIVMPSLDAVFQENFLRVNRPCKGLDCHGMIEGLKAFSREFSGELNLEIFVIPGVNDSQEEILAFQRVIDEINPTLIQLNTLDRPGTVESVLPATQEQLERVARILDRENIRIIARPKENAAQGNKEIDLSSDEIRDMILETIHRRPCTAKDLSTTLGQEQSLIEQELSRLLEKGKVQAKTRERGVFYQTRKESRQ